MPYRHLLQYWHTDYYYHTAIQTTTIILPYRLLLGLILQNMSFKKDKKCPKILQAEKCLTITNKQ